jgi:hypothetical protein
MPCPVVSWLKLNKRIILGLGRAGALLHDKIAALKAVKYCQTMLVALKINEFDGQGTNFFAGQPRNCCK